MPFGPNEGNITHPHPQASHDGEREPNGRWAVVPLASGARPQQLHVQAPPTIPKEQQGSQITFSESDFPPLSSEGGMVAGRGRGKRGAWLGRRNL